MRTQDMGWWLLLASSNYWQTTFCPPRSFVTASCKFLSCVPLSSGEAGNPQAKQSSVSRTMAADFTSCRAEPSSLLICFLQFLPQTAASHPCQVDSCHPLNHMASVRALQRPHTFRKKEEGKKTQMTVMIIRKPEWKWDYPLQKGQNVVYILSSCHRSLCQAK